MHLSTAWRELSAGARGSARRPGHGSREATKRFKPFGSGGSVRMRTPPSVLLAAVALQSVDIGFDFRRQNSQTTLRGRGQYWPPLRAFQEGGLLTRRDGPIENDNEHNGKQRDAERPKRRA